MACRGRHGDFLGRYTFFVLLAVAITVGGQIRASRNAQSVHQAKPMQACVEDSRGQVIDVGLPGNKARQSAECMERLRRSSPRVAIAPIRSGESHRKVKPSVAL